MAHDRILEERLAAALGVGGNPAAMDVLKRSDFASDGEYIQACVDWEMKHNDPARAELTRKYTRALQEQREQEAARKQAEHEKEVYDNMKLTAAEAARVDATATEATVQALKDGRITHDDFTQARERAVEKLTERTLREKTGQALFNEQIREMYQATRDFDDKTEKEMSKEFMQTITGGNTGNNAY